MAPPPPRTWALPEAKDVAKKRPAAAATTVQEPTTNTPTDVEEGAKKQFYVMDYKSKGVSAVRAVNGGPQFCQARPGGDWGPTKMCRVFCRFRALPIDAMRW